LALPPGATEETETAVRRLLELTTILARRCAQLQEALDSRVVIEQAKGILAERLDIEPDRAFELLRLSARSHRILLRDLAQQVVAEWQTPEQISALLNGR
jgi:AmiR/NasT family two-component response regulator